ncbi:MAG: trypsin-like serine protease, partial [Thermoguttaceae bacterium]
GDGDFVVTWSQQSAATSWDVYARRFDSMGSPLGTAFLVNSETDDVQRYSSVAMDIDGDFVITWQSNNQDESGYGIYGQRFSAEGDFIGGTGEIQVLTFTGNPVGTFKLQFEGKTTAAITYSGNPFAIAGTVESQLRAIGANVEVVAANLTGLGIRFLGRDGLEDQQQILVVNSVITGDAGAKIAATTQSDGDTGEFLVNETTENNQVYPNVAMDSNGTFVITWTGFGQDGDAANESNIYAKQFVSNEAFLNTTGSLGRVEYDWNGLSQQFPDTERIVTVDSPANHLTSTGTGYDGVVQIYDGALGSLNGAIGSGSLLYTGRHILTAAHVVDDGTGVPVPSIQVGFDLPGVGRVSLTATEIYMHPSWNGDLFAGNDIAIIVLPETAPGEADRYDIYRGSNELGKETALVGYGNIGIGLEDPTLFDGQKRFDYNTFDAYGEALNGMSTADFYLGPGAFDMPEGKILLLDFDNGLRANDALGRAAGKWNLGLGLREGDAARGDSGGPSFLNGVITGLASGGIEYAPADVDAIGGNISYGDIAWYTRVSAFADWIDQVVQSSSSEFLVNANVLDPLTGAILVDHQTNDQMWSTVSLDADGDFVITWTNDAPDIAGTGSGIGAQDADGVYARRYDSGTNPLSEAFQVNTSTAGEQQFSRAAMDADGDFVITWESNTPAGFDILAQRYVGSDKLALANPTAYGANGAIGGEFTVNTTKAGAQRFPGIAMDNTGDYLIVWSGAGSQPGQVSTQGVYGQRLQLRQDTAGPTVTEVQAMTVSTTGAEMARLINGTTFDQSVGAIAITFGENLSTFMGNAGRESVLNVNNWELTRDGELVPNGVWQLQFTLNQSTHKYEAVLMLDDDPDKAGAQPLASGDYVLTLRDAVEDLFENRLDGNYDGTPGGSFTVSFTVVSKSGPLPDPGTPDEDDSDEVVNEQTLNDQSDPAVARAPDGSYVVVWTSLNDPLLDADGDPVDDLNGNPIVYTNVYARQFDRYGEPLSGDILVTSYTTGNQGSPDVAIDQYGNFVVVWQGEGEDVAQKKTDTSGIFARVFDAYGSASGAQFLVNATHDGIQSYPAVAMNDRGEIVFTWLSQSQGGIMGRRFALNGNAIGGEFRVNSTTGNNHATPDVAIDNDGDFAITWSSAEQDNGSSGVFAQRFTASGSRAGGEFMVNQYQTDKQDKPRIAMSDAGDFVIAWQSFGQDAFGGYGIYARRFASTGSSLGNEFRVNDFTTGYQFEPSVGMDSNGDFVVTWSSFNQEGDQGELYGIFAKMYNADGSLFILPGASSPLGEFRVNALLAGDQRASDVAMDADGHYAVVWQGISDAGFVPDPNNAGILIPIDGIDIYGRVVDPPITTLADSTVLDLFGTPGQDTFEFVAGATPSSWIVKINGVAQTVASTVTTVNFDAMGGNDTITLTGTSGVDKVFTYPGRVTLEGTGFTVAVSDAENVTVNGKGGTDVAELRDSAGNDLVIMKVGETVMSGLSYSSKVVGFEQVYAYASTGVDEARLYDTSGADTFTGTSQYVRMEGAGYMHRAKGFRYAHGYSSGGADVAELHDSQGDDKFKYQSGQAKMFGGGFYVRAKGFADVNAIADGGGNDYARIFDSSSVDEFVGKPTSARMTSTQAKYDVTAELFEKVLAYSSAGGNDIARFFDSAKKETFWGIKDKAQFLGDGFDITARKFEKVEATSTPGSGDIAKLRDTAANNHLVVDDASAKMYEVNGAEMDLLYEAFAFDQVKTYRSSGTDTKNVASTVDFLLLDDGWSN